MTILNELEIPITFFIFLWHFFVLYQLFKIYRDGGNTAFSKKLCVMLMMVLIFGISMLGVGFLLKLTKTKHYIFLSLLYLSSICALLVLDMVILVISAKNVKKVKSGLTKMMCLFLIFGSLASLTSELVLCIPVYQDIEKLSHPPKSSHHTHASNKSESTFDIKPISQRDMIKIGMNMMNGNGKDSTSGSGSLTDMIQNSVSQQDMMKAAQNLMSGEGKSSLKKSLMSKMTTKEMETLAIDAAIL